MNKWRLKKSSSIILLLLFQTLYSMEERVALQITDQDNLSLLPTELKIHILTHSIIKYVDDFDLDDSENREQNLYNLVRNFPKFIEPLKRLNKEFNNLILDSKEFLNLYFKYLLTLKLKTLGIEIQKHLLETIKLDKQCSNLVVILLVISTLDYALSSFSQFKITYKLTKEAIEKRSIYLCRFDNKAFDDFHYNGILNFDPAKFENTKLLEIFIKNQSGKEDSEILLDLYEFIFCLKSNLKKELLNIATEDKYFKQKYLSSEIAQAIAFQDIERAKAFLVGPIIENFCSNNGYTPLIIATIFEVKEIIEHLLQMNEEWLISNHAIYFAASSKNSDLLKLFTDRINQFNISFIKLFETAILTENNELFEITKRYYQQTQKKPPMPSLSV